MRPIWLRMPVATQKREELARRTGIPATNLSAMNTGEMPMTPTMAARIANAVQDIPELAGTTVLDLGATEEAVAGDAPALIGVLDRLQKVEDEKASVPNVDAMFRVFAAAIDSLAKGDTRAALRLLSKAGVL